MPQKLLVHKNKLNTIYRELVILENDLTKEGTKHLEQVQKILERIQVLILLSNDVEK